MTLYMMAGYMSRYLQVFLQVNPAILATMLLVWEHLGCCERPPDGYPDGHFLLQGEARCG